MPLDPYLHYPWGHLHYPWGRLWRGAAGGVTRRTPFSIGGGVVDFLHMTAAMQTTLKEVGEMLTHVVEQMATHPWAHSGD